MEYETIGTSKSFPPYAQRSLSVTLGNSMAQRRIRLMIAKLAGCNERGFRHVFDLLLGIIRSVPTAKEMNMECKLNTSSTARTLDPQQ